LDQPRRSLATHTLQRRIATLEICRGDGSCCAGKALTRLVRAAQITDASHLVVFAAKKNFGEADVDSFIKHTATARGVSVESLSPFRNMLVGGIVQSMDEKGRDAWARNQVYIALGNLLTSAALLGIDACPMEGFDRAQYDELLGLHAEGFATAVIATVGYRASGDKYANAPKVRFPMDRLFTRI
jgi:nitroreductase